LEEFNHGGFGFYWAKLFFAQAEFGCVLNSGLFGCVLNSGLFFRFVNGKRNCGTIKFYKHLSNP
jgi:hypothetical protein